MTFDALRYHSDTILPFLFTGTTVIEPRSPFDRIAKAAAFNCGNVDFISSLIRTYCFYPTIHILLEVSPEEAIRRVKLRGSDSEDLDTLRRYAASLSQMAESLPITIVDGMGAPHETHAKIWNVIEAKLIEVGALSDLPKG
jgi:thymidylate kinase